MTKQTEANYSIRFSKDTGITFKIYNLGHILPHGAGLRLFTQRIQNSEESTHIEILLDSTDDLSSTIEKTKSEFIETNNCNCVMICRTENIDIANQIKEKIKNLKIPFGEKSILRID